MQKKMSNLSLCLQPRISDTNIRDIEDGAPMPGHICRTYADRLVQGLAQPMCQGFTIGVQVESREEYAGGREAEDG
jgi:hypothetical protein